MLSVGSPLVVASDKALWVMKEHRLKTLCVRPFCFSTDAVWSFSFPRKLTSQSQSNFFARKFGQVKRFYRHLLLVYDQLDHYSSSILFCFLFRLLNELPKNTWPNTAAALRHISLHKTRRFRT